MFVPVPSKSDAEARNLRSNATSGTVPFKDLEQELNAFVGWQADYYLARWKAKSSGRAPDSGNNIAAAFFTLNWLVYRKMYKKTLFVLVLSWVAFFVVPIVVSMFFITCFGIVLPIVPLMLLDFLFVFVFVGINGNEWYFLHSCAEIDSVRRQDLSEEAHLKTLAQRGGTNCFAPLGVFVVGNLIPVVMTYFAHALINVP